MTCLYILEINWQLHCLQIFFSHSIGCLFILCMVSFAIRKLLSLIKSHLFISITLGDSSKNILLPFVFCLCFSPGIL